MIICNSSPLIALALIDCLSILDNFKIDWCVPEAVFDEVTKKSKPFSKKLNEFLIGKVEKVLNDETLSDLLLLIDRGEAEVIQLGLEKSANCNYGRQTRQKYRFNKRLKRDRYSRIIIKSKRKRFNKGNSPFN